MKRQEWSLLYLAILAMVVVGLFTFGVPTLTLVYAAFALACPPMLIFVPGGAVAAPERIAASQATASTSLPTGGDLTRRSS
jgi:hypothetical protein